MSSRQSVNATERYEDEFYKFLKSRILRLGGKIQLQHITGHLSQIRPEVRNAIGSSKVDIAKFLEKYNDTFVINNNYVSVIEKNYESDTSSVDIEASLPNNIKQGKGAIIKLFPKFGFIKCTDPVKSTAYFSANSYVPAKNFDENVDLTDCKIYVGTMVYFNAVKEQSGKKVTSKYRATEVWKYDTEEERIIHYSKKTQETGVFDPINLDDDGYIQKVFPNFGFITVRSDNKNTVFFQKTQVANFDNIVDLTQIFKPGDAVEFTAHRTVKKDAKARYQAVKVWKKSSIKSSTKQNTAKTESNSSAISSATSKSGSSFVKPGAFLKLPGFYSKSSPMKDIVKPKNTSREIIYDELGKICPRGNTAVIKFGDNFSQLADGDSSVYYVCGTQVTEISWEFNDGDIVHFDAVKIKSAPGWKALLVWVGKKPDVLLGPHLGDFSEFTDDEIDEIPNDTDSSVSGKQISLSSHSSLKSVSMNSESSDLKTNKSCRESLMDNDSASNTEDRHANNSGFKQRNLCNSPSVYNVQCNRSSPKESKHLDLKYETNRSEASFDELSVCSSKDSKKVKKGSTPLNNYKSENSKNSKDILEEFKSSTSLSSCSSKESKTSKNSKDLQTKFNSSTPQSCTSKVSITSENSRELQKELNRSTSLSSCALKESEITKISEEFKTQSNNFDDDSNQYVDDKYVSEKSISNFDANAHLPSEESSESSDEFKTINITESVETKNDEIRIEASITRNNNVIGKITKAYSTCAEAACSELPNPIAFFWSVFYRGKKSKEELGLKDLRQVLKVGDTINFNFFHIVDDAGQNWKKVSLAWVGHKPLTFYEITPEEFIKQNDLSVSVKNKSQNIKHKKIVEKVIKKFLVACDDISPNDEVSPSDGISSTYVFNPNDRISLSDEVCSTYEVSPRDEVSPRNEVSTKDEVSPSDGISPSDEFSSTYEVNPNDKISLSDEVGSAYEVSPRDEVNPSNEVRSSDEVSPSNVVGTNNEASPTDETIFTKKNELYLSQTESDSDEESDAYHSPEPFLFSDKQTEAEDLTPEFQTLSNMISQKLLMNRDLFTDFKVDLNSFSSEIVHLIIQQYRNVQPCQTLLLKDPPNETTHICSCTKKVSTEVQTISTGEIMSQNIFTEC